MARTVLIVDDSQVVRKALCQLLSMEGYFEVCGEAEDGLDAIQKAKQLHPELIVIDLSMPRMSGLDAVRALKKLMPDTPIIMYSNYSDPFVEWEARAAGASDFLPKSEDIRSLVKRAKALFHENAV
ncbi:MAG: hypothetical protein NVS9B5_33380 [Terriglobales bacterium]